MGRRDRGSSRCRAALITVGNLAETYRFEQGIAASVEPWSELAGYRHLLAHALPGDLSSDRVVADTTVDLERILNDVRIHPG